ncbi:MAG: hypothetical protein WD208_04935 [Dehalococcoidia bacterium]
MLDRIRVASLLIGLVGLAGFVVITQAGSGLGAPGAVMDYERAVYSGDYSRMWNLASESLRAGQSKEDFINRAQATSPGSERILDYAVQTNFLGDSAVSHSRLELESGQTAMHRLSLERVGGRWLIAGYEDYSGTWPLYTSGDRERDDHQRLWPGGR